jgi:hypothetical protein
MNAGEAVLYVSPIQRFNSAYAAAWQTYQRRDLSKADWRTSLAGHYKDEVLKHLAHLFGVYPQTLTAAGLKQLRDKLTKAYEITAFNLLQLLKPKLVRQRNLSSTQVKMVTRLERWERSCRVAEIK